MTSLAERLSSKVEQEEHLDLAKQIDVMLQNVQDRATSIQVEEMADQVQIQLKDVVRLLNDKVDSSLFSPFHHKLSTLDGLHAKVELVVHNMHSFL